jgi:hypothetical protein
VSVQIHSVLSLSEKIFNIKVICSRDFDCKLEVLLTWLWPTLRCAMSCPTRSNRPHNQFLIISSPYWINNVTSLPFIWTIMIVKSTTATKGQVCVGTVSCLGSPQVLCTVKRLQTRWVPEEPSLLTWIRWLPICRSWSQDVSMECLSCLEHKDLCLHSNGFP